MTTTYPLMSPNVLSLSMKNWLKCHSMNNLSKPPNGDLSDAEVSDSEDSDLEVDPVH